jgi:hypothetical protein
VVDFETWNGELYATGFFNTLCGTSCNYVAKWDGAVWMPAGNGFEEAGHQLQTVGSELYGVRYEQQVDSNWLYRYDGANFLPVGEGVYLTTAASGTSQTANLYNLIEYNGGIVVCGEFDRVGNQPVSGIVQRAGNQWLPLGSGLSGHIAGTAPVMYPHDLCIYGGDLIVAGNFLGAGDETVNGIARWDGMQWHAFGQGFNGTVYAAAVFGGTLYASGDFTQSGSSEVRHIARWNGSYWEEPGFHVSYANPNYSSYVHTLEVLNDKLVISGGFDRITQGSETMNCAAVIAFDGSVIDTLAGGLAGKEAEALELYNGLLYAGGGLNGSSYIARYEDVTSIEELTGSFSVFPNPSEGTVHIESDAAWQKLRICNAQGQTIAAVDTFVSGLNIDLPHSGLYFVTVWKNGRRYMQKVAVR